MLGIEALYAVLQDNKKCLSGSSFTKQALSVVVDFEKSLDYYLQNISFYDKIQFRQIKRGKPRLPLIMLKISFSVFPHLNTTFRRSLCRLSEPERVSEVIP